MFYLAWFLKVFFVSTLEYMLFHYFTKSLDFLCTGLSGSEGIFSMFFVVGQSNLRGCVLTVGLDRLLQVHVPQNSAVLTCHFLWSYGVV